MTFSRAIVIGTFLLSAALFAAPAQAQSQTLQGTLKLRVQIGSSGKCSMKIQGLNKTWSSAELLNAGTIKRKIEISCTAPASGFLTVDKGSTGKWIMRGPSSNVDGVEDEIHYLLSLENGNPWGESILNCKQNSPCPIVFSTDMNGKATVRYVLGFDLPTLPTAVWAPGEYTDTLTVTMHY